MIDGRGYEEELADLFRQNGHIASIRREPKVNGKTPDILVRTNDGFECIIECTEAHLENRHNNMLNCEVDISDPLRSVKLHDKIEEKLKVYSPEVIGGRSYVIAAHNMTLESFDISALSVCFGERTRHININRVTKKATRHGWTRALNSKEFPGLLEMKQNRHCSGILITKDWIDQEHNRHLLIPNPGAAVPVPEYIFDFARVSELTIEPDGSTPSRAPEPYLPSN